MSWDVMIFNLKQKVTSVEEIEDELLVPVNFSTVIEQHFKDVISDEDHRGDQRRSFFDQLLRRR